MWPQMQLKNTRKMSREENVNLAKQENKHTRKMSQEEIVYVVKRVKQGTPSGSISYMNHITHSQSCIYIGAENLLKQAFPFLSSRSKSSTYAILILTISKQLWNIIGMDGFAIFQ